MRIGLDYDDTITAYPEAMKVLARSNTIIVVTLNTEITPFQLQQILGSRPEHVLVMPDNEFDTTSEDVGVGLWKAKMCEEYRLDLMIDDLQSVCEACTNIGIPSIQVHLKG